MQAASAGKSQMEATGRPSLASSNQSLFKYLNQPVNDKQNRTLLEWQKRGHF